MIPEDLGIRTYKSRSKGNGENREVIEILGKIPERVASWARVESNC